MTSDEVRKRFDSGVCHGEEWERTVMDILVELAGEVEKNANARCRGTANLFEWQKKLQARIEALERDQKVHWLRLVDLKTRIEALERGMCIGTHHIDHCPVHGDGGCS